MDSIADIAFTLIGFIFSLRLRYAIIAVGRCVLPLLCTLVLLSAITYFCETTIVYGYTTYVLVPVWTCIYGLVSIFVNPQTVFVVLALAYLCLISPGSRSQLQTFDTEDKLDGSPPPSPCKVSDDSSASISVNSLLQTSAVHLDANVFRQLTDERHQFYVRVQELERANAGLRQRIWFLEDNGASLRADIVRRAGEYDTLMKTKEEAISERERVMREMEVMKAEMEVVAGSTKVLMKEVERLEKEISAVEREMEALLDEKAAYKRLPINEKAKTEELEEEMKEEQEIASKQATPNEVVEDAEVLEGKSAENDGLKPELEVFRKSTATVTATTESQSVKEAPERLQDAHRKGNFDALVLTLQERETQIAQLTAALAERTEHLCTPKKMPQKTLILSKVQVVGPRAEETLTTLSEAGNKASSRTAASDFSELRL